MTSDLKASKSRIIWTFYLLMNWNDFHILDPSQKLLYGFTWNFLSSCHKNSTFISASRILLCVHNNFVPEQIIECFIAYNNLQFYEERLIKHHFYEFKWHMDCIHNSVYCTLNKVKKLKAFSLMWYITK